MKKQTVLRLAIEGAVVAACPPIGILVGINETINLNVDSNFKEVNEEVSKLKKSVDDTDSSVKDLSKSAEKLAPLAVRRFFNLSLYANRFVYPLVEASSL